MRSFVPLLVLIIFGLLMITNAHRKGRIINGQDALDRKFPYLVAIMINLETICAGSILNQRWILTAAHCFKGVNISSLMVLAGVNDLLNENPDVYQIESYIYHENFTVETRTDDIALVQVNEDIKYNEKVQPINLPTENINQSDSSIIFAGWGATGMVNGEYEISTNLRVIEVNIFDENKCRFIWKIMGETITDSQICTSAGKGAGVCFGDSGSPLVINGTVIGLTSYGIKNPCGSGVPDVFTKVYSYLDWINGHIQN